MATVAHIIRSHYDPADRDKLERKTGQQINDPSDTWQTESSFSAQRRLKAPPAFVPATVLHDEWGVPLRTLPVSTSIGEPSRDSISVAEWYRSLTSATSSSLPHAPSRPSSAPSPATRVSEPSRAQQSLGREAAKDPWFIRKALRSEPSTKPSSPTPSLSDMLTRDPPPLPREGRYVPPVWLHIGPSNRGFAMLQRSGWNEGEALGAHVARPVAVREEYEHVKNAGPEVVDLTQSDSEISLPDASEDDDIAKGSVSVSAKATGEASTSHMQKSLLTPLPIVLKADRLGIGLKAKTEGPYRRSKKRVTHNTGALAAHIRAAEELRRKRAIIGRGTRGFSRVLKREEDSRKAMLYFNE